ncbi:hypothetical protein BT67DRAFT_294327 [Trichocladium antarcticum]|uniref:Uncharacterized protein n=1 Tax=Trichocladium antarcticum TaxID=1450529 RepID=A0AAN6UK05_9PEZI|nr:hypothetical protein BT67DRAFT_294327 [Trichocladium antarcticum]
MAASGKLVIIRSAALGASIEGTGVASCVVVKSKLRSKACQESGIRLPLVGSLVAAGLGGVGLLRPNKWGLLSHPSAGGHIPCSLLFIFLKRSFFLSRQLVLFSSSQVFFRLGCSNLGPCTLSILNFAPVCNWLLHSSTAYTRGLEPAVAGSRSLTYFGGLAKPHSFPHTTTQPRHY